MKLSTDALLERVYHYYTRGIGGMDLDYPTTDERLRRVELCRSAGIGEPYDRFRQMLRRLESKHREFRIQDGSMHLAGGNFDACYSAKAWLPSSAPDVSDYYLGFFIGIIAPVYAIYRTIRHAPPESKLWSMTEQVRYMKQHPFEHSFTLASQEQPYAGTICAEIEATFGAEPLTAEVGAIIVSDVDAGHRGFGKETLFTCLLSGEL